MAKPKISPSAWAVPTQSMMTANNQSSNISPAVKKPAGAVFNPVKFDKEKKKVFGMM